MLPGWAVGRFGELDSLAPARSALAGLRLAPNSFRRFPSASSVSDVLENPESDEGPWHMTGQTQDQIMELWRLLQIGYLAAIRQRPWLAGYGGGS
jgi:hypothetical protein